MNADDVQIAVLLTVVGSILTFGTASVLALGWAVRSGQFENFDRSAQVIFDADEPPGVPTDTFPHQV